MRLTISLLVAAVLLAGCTSATPNVPPGTVSATMAEASTATATPTLPADTLPDTQPAESVSLPRRGVGRANKRATGDPRGRRYAV